MNLPVCIHRGDEIDGRFPCGTDRLIHSGYVEAETCLRCPYANKPRRKPKGLGDTLHRFLHATGIAAVVRGCGCGKRKSWLNRIIPYKGS